MKEFGRVAPVLAALLAAACSSGNAQKDGQVLAVVDGTEITAPMLETSLSNLPSGIDPKDPAVQKAALQQLVDETLLAKQAESLKLDTTPGVTRTLSAVRRQVLANAYLDKSVTSTKPSDVEIVNYFGQHPYLFADRRRYALSVVQLKGEPQAVTTYLAAFNQPGMTADGLADKMGGDGISVVADRNTVDADQLPDRVARALANAQSGTNVTYRQGDVQHFLHVESVAPSPVPLALARGTIARYLQEKRKAELTEASVKQLRGSAQVTFQGSGRSIMKPALADGPVSSADKRS